MRPLIRCIVFFMALNLVGCAVGPNFKTPAAPTTPRYTETPMPEQTVSAKSPGGQAQRFNLGEEIPADWWALFHSPALDALIRQGMANSPNIASAQAALRQARQNLLAEIGSGLFPSVSSAMSLERQRFAGDTIGVNESDIFNLYNASVNVSYTLDVFGGIRRQIEAEAALVDYQRYQLEAAYLTLAANIVTTAITEASLRDQIRATHELINSQERQLQILQGQFKLGGVALTDVLTQQTEVSQTIATLPPLEKNLAQTRHALAVLVGSFPGDIHIPEFNLNTLTLPAQLPVSLPSNLVRQRPDVRAQEALLHQASAQIGVATANMLPQFTLTADYGYANNALNTLFTTTNSFWSIMGQATQPIFQGGALIAQRRAAVAAYDQAAAEYRQTVLTAFKNVADALRAVQMDAKALRAQAVAEKSARQTLALSEEQYRLGGVSYLNILTAERQYQSTRIDRIQAQAARFADTAALFQALGGGWWNRSALSTPRPTIKVRVS